MQASEQSTFLLRQPLNGCRKTFVGCKPQWVVNVKESMIRFSRSQALD